MIGSTVQAKSCVELLEAFRRSKPEGRGEKLRFDGVGGRDVYNITAPFMDDGEWVIAGRVENRHDERSEVMFFIEREGVWVPREKAPVFALQDPFCTFVRGELVFGGVEVEFDPEDPHYVSSWRTVFFRGPRVAELRRFTAGPPTMKDIRVVELRNGRIGVFTRPMMVGDARAMIGYTEIDSLEGLTEESILRAELLHGQFLPDEWGGGNEAHALSNGWIGVLGHIAYMDEANYRHYYAMTFAFHPDTRRHTPPKLIATRDMFPPGEAKRPDLADVLFSGGLCRHPDGTATLYTGVSDAEAHKLVIRDPFLEYERL
jgi:hypothetical protein